MGPGFSESAATYAQYAYLLDPGPEMGAVVLGTAVVAGLIALGTAIVGATQAGFEKSAEAKMAKEQRKVESSRIASEMNKKEEPVPTAAAPAPDLEQTIIARRTKDRRDELVAAA
tara:strand:- start:1745 stop:2089 length:345 start_codon:yes stop_codon:yes gene_type:complete